MAPPSIPIDPLGFATPHVVATVLASLSLYLNRWGSYVQFTDRVTTYWDYGGEDYDFIIVGGGSAGGVVASRLSVYYRVLLLEAGGRINPLQTIPALSLMMLNYPEIDWKHKTVPQKHSCFGLPGNKSHWSQGKGLGGTSNLNFLIQSRGNPKDFDNWANMTGDDHWSYENLLPYFRLSEDYHGKWDNAKTHGKNGPLRITLPEYTGMADIYIKAAEELGYPQADLNGFYTEGFDSIYYPIKNGRRHGVFGAYIEEAMYRTGSKLTVRRFARVKKILINKSSMAYGVEYDWHGKPQSAFANKEVIVSAGAMMSPQLLMLSGVGPKDHLEYFGIEVKSDLPVGNNLQDHISAYLGPFFVDQPISFSIERDVTSINIANFFTQGRGILTTSGTQAMGFFSSTHAKKAGEADWPDIQIILAGVAIGKGFAADFARGFGIKKKVLEKYWDHAVGTDSFLQIVSLGRPHAKGDIRLQSVDPYSTPLIDPKYLNNRHDVDVLVEGVKKAVQIIEETEAFKRIKGRFTEVSFPGCENITFRSDEYWECYVTHFSVTLHHIVGSCSMGARGSKDAVVDTQLKVIGIDRLRVIDASVMPAVVVGNTNAPTIMIGEKGSDLILFTYEAERLAAEAERIKQQQEAAEAEAAAAAAEAAAIAAAEAEAEAAAAAAEAAEAAAQQQQPLVSSTKSPSSTEVVEPNDPDDPDDPDETDDPERIKSLHAKEFADLNISERNLKKLTRMEQEELFLKLYTSDAYYYSSMAGYNSSTIY